MSGERLWTAIAAVGAVAVFVAALAIAGVFGDGDDGSEPAADDFGAPEVTETVQAEAAPPEPQVKRIEIGGTPDIISAGAGYVWVGDSLAGKLQRIHPQSLRPVDVQSAGFPTDISATDQAAWLALPDRGAIESLTVKGSADVENLRGFPFQLAAGQGAVWAMSQNSAERVDTQGPIGNLDGPPIKFGGSGSAIASGEGYVWVTRNNRDVVRISPRSDFTFEQTAEVKGAFNITTGESAVWVLGAKGQITRLDPESGEVAGDPVQTGRGTDVAAGLGFVWVTSDDGTVIRFDPESGAEVGVPIQVGREPTAIAIGEGAVWVAASGEGAVYRITP